MSTELNDGAEDPAEAWDAEAHAEAWETLIADLHFFKGIKEADAKFPGETRQDLCLSAVYKYLKKALKATGKDAELAAPLK